MNRTKTWADWSCAVDVTTQESVLDAAAETVRALMADVGRAASRFRSDSDLSRINAAAGRLVQVSPLTVTLVEVACAAAEATAGAVDPMIGADLVAAGYDADIEDVRRRRTAPSAAPRVRSDWSQIRIDHVLGRIGIPAGTRLDLGATAKAWTAEEAAKRIEERSGHPVAVGIGGDVALVGEPDGGWLVDVSELRGRAAEPVRVAAGALATSSTLGRRFMDDAGVERHHLIDPRTGGAAQSPWRTATVWAPDAVTANTWSTWLLVDADCALSALRSRNFPARLVDQTGQVVGFGGWAASEVA